MAARARIAHDSGSMSKHVHRVMQLEVPAEKVFAFLSDPENNARWIPGLVSVSAVSGKGVGGRYIGKLDVGGLETIGEVLQYDAARLRLVRRNIGPGPLEAMWTYEVRPTGESSCEFELDVVYRAHVPVVGKVFEAVLSKVDESGAAQAEARLRAALAELG